MVRAAEIHSGAGDVFMSRHWHVAWREAFAGGEHWCETPEGVAVMIGRLRLGPFRIQRARLPCNAHTPWVSLPHVAVARGLRAWFDGSHCDLLVLPLLRRTAALYSVFPPDWLTRWQPGERAPFVDCRGRWEDYWSNRGRKTRSEWARAERRLDAEGFALECHDGVRDLDDVLAEVFAIEGDGWKGEGGSAIAQSKALVDFYRRVCHAWAAQGRLRVYFLARAGERVACQLCVVSEGRLVSLKIGFRHAYARFAPGQVLQLKILRASFPDPEVSRFDMLGPETVHKRKWATDAEQLWNVRVYRLTPGGLLSAWRWSLVPALRAWLRGAGAASADG
ncbi:GNAT family N-acetyltransferase [Arhodomonas sp. SL1]|uniref:GNAT family N-acetyltransferase n=1 Tax=Arhodomonas sp. SL1 TaxID=3425691 RepID=UPI003F882934